MICPHCGKHIPLERERKSPLCPHCGSRITIAPDSHGAQSQLIRQNETASTGPLLTGNIVVDTVIGFLEELVAVALIVYAFALLIRPNDYPPILSILGVISTAIFLFGHATTMRKRFPKFAKGWQLGRDTWGKGIDLLITLLFGISALTVLFPLGALVFYMSVGLGTFGWVLALGIIYLFGFLTRRMLNKGNPKT